MDPVPWIQNMFRPYPQIQRYKLNVVSNEKNTHDVFIIIWRKSHLAWNRGPSLGVISKRDMEKISMRYTNTKILGESMPEITNTPLVKHKTFTFVMWILLFRIRKLTNISFVFYLLSHKFQTTQFKYQIIAYMVFIIYIWDFNLIYRKLFYFCFSLFK